MPKRRRAPKLSEVLVSALSEKIASGELQTGDKLPTESEIMSQYGVSRTVVREAIQNLQAAGLVQTRHGVGTFVVRRVSDMGVLLTVTKDSMRDMASIIEFRLGLEVEAAGLAAERRTASQMKALNQTVEALQEHESAGRSELAGAEDARFHLAIAEATGNRYFIDVMRHLRQSLGPIVSTQRIDPQCLNHEHREICLAIERQDPYSARAAMRLHLANSKQRLLRLAQE
ncbi:MAG: FadR/GntR family transcriptional regulator [Pontibacterium sp.]